MRVIYKPIGVIHSPFKDLAGMPIQPTSRASRPGTIEIYPEFVEGLKDLDGFSHVYLLYHLHQVHRSKLRVTPFLDTKPRGVFATRAPPRPNPIGLSIARIIGIKDRRIRVDRVDTLDGTPLLDIKPYVPGFEPTQNVRTGWLEKSKARVRTQKSDARFREMNPRRKTKPQRTRKGATGSL